MKRTLLRILGLASFAVAIALFTVPDSALSPASAQVKAQTRQVQGNIVRMDAGQLVVKTSANEQLTVHVRPQTRFMLKDKLVKVTDLRIGASVTVNAILEGDRHFADSVVIVDEPLLGQDTLVEGEIVRVIGQDQVLVRTPERKEVIVFVNPQTTFLLENRAGRFVDLRVGAPVRVNVNVHEGRHTARHIVVTPRNK